MTVPVECPHCTTVYHLAAELAGKSMRCPNPDCREVFQVSVPAPPSDPPTLPDPAVVRDVPRAETVCGPVPETSRQTLADQPYERIEKDAFDDPIRPLAAEPTEFALPAPDPSLYEQPPTKPRVSEFPRVKSSPVSRPRTGTTDVPVAEFTPKKKVKAGPKTVAWTDMRPPVAAPVAEFAEPRSDDGTDDGVFERRVNSRPQWSKYVLGGLILGVLCVVGFIGIGALTVSQRAESKLAADAEEAYKEAKYAVAAEFYRQAETSYPLSPRHEEYQFFAALADARSAADSVLIRDNPTAARAKLDDFLKSFGDSPYARPDVTFGSDIAQLGRKVADAMADFAGSRVTQFRADRTKPELLDLAEKTAEEGPLLLKGLEKFRGKDAPGFEDQAKKFADVSASVHKERDRLAVLAPFRTLADDPTDESIDEAETKFRQTGLADDAEAKQIVTRAKEALGRLIGATPAAEKAVRPPTDLHPPILFAAAPLGSPEPRPNADFIPDVVFAAVRGVLYALDAESGKPLWGTRVADGVIGDPRLNDVPVRFPVSESGPEWVLVAAEVNGRRGIAARDARTGDVKWYQPLDAPLAGRPAVVGRRTYVPLADPFGTVLEIQLSTGTILGHLAIRQPVGAGLTGLPGTLPGSGFLFVPADARRVFVFEVGKESADGIRETPRKVRVIATDHPKESLRGEPILVTPPIGDGPRYLILPQTDGPERMKLRCFRLPSDLTADGSGADGTDAPAPIAEVEQKGWSWYPPTTDGERVVAATDAGSVAVFGVNQVGNSDPPLFNIPAPAQSGELAAVNRALVVAVDEDSAWVVVGNKLSRMRTALDPARGLRVIPDGRSELVGEPIHRAQVRPLSGLGVVVTSSGSAPGLATAFDLGNGRIRWQRALGAVAAAAPITGENHPPLLIDEAGGVYQLPAGQTDNAEFATVVAPPVREPLGKVHVARSADGRTIWVLEPEGNDGAKRLRVRKVVEGAAQPDTVLPLPEFFAGPPVAVGETLLTPLRDGFVYRLGSGGLTKGPVWRSGANPDADCFLASIDSDEFVATDGADIGGGVIRWRWPTGGKPERRGGPWRISGRLAAPPVVLNTGENFRFVAVDAEGPIKLFEPRVGDDPVGQWGTGLPPGSPGGRLDVLAAGEKTRLIYAADRRHMVCLDPDDEAPVWVARGPDVADAPEVVGWAVVGGKLIVTDQTARLTVIDLTTGKQLPDVPINVTGIAAAEAVPTGDGYGLLSLADGTVVSVSLPK